MDVNQRTEQKRVVVDTPGIRREVVTARTQREPAESGVSTGMVALIAIFAITAIGIIVYVVSNRNANESADRNANIDVASQPTNQPATTIIQQPAALPLQAPIIIQQPAPAQQVPVIIQQAAQPSQNTGARDDAIMQEVAARRLIEDPDMGSVSITVSEARAVLTGTASSEAIKARAERLVKEVSGVKSVDNKIFVPGA